MDNKINFITLDQALNRIVDYDGRPALLQTFLNLAQRLHDALEEADKTLFVYRILLGLKGRATEVITDITGIETFLQLKALLKEKIPHKIDFESAFVEIQQIKQQHNEHLLDYIRRFEAAYQNLEKASQEGPSNQIMAIACNLFIQNMLKGEMRAVAMINDKGNIKQLLDCVKKHCVTILPEPTDIICMYCKSKIKPKKIVKQRN